MSTSLISGNRKETVDGGHMRPAMVCRGPQTPGNCPWWVPTGAVTYRSTDLNSLLELVSAEASGLWGTGFAWGFHSQPSAVLCCCAPCWESLPPLLPDPCLWASSRGLRHSLFPGPLEAVLTGSDQVWADCLPRVSLRCFFESWAPSWHPQMTVKRGEKGMQKTSVLPVLQIWVGAGSRFPFLHPMHLITEPLGCILFGWWGSDQCLKWLGTLLKTVSDRSKWRHSQAPPLPF